ncbi:MAG TPA: hypothetical protein GXX66_00890 [Acholeplasmataceae bacterium]|jgi:hypothetical protein|nr:hypothetical protein [Acholeplasmataceae bacterium]
MKKTITLFILILLLPLLTSCKEKINSLEDFFTLIEKQNYQLITSFIRQDESKITYIVELDVDKAKLTYDVYDGEGLKTFSQITYVAKENRSIFSYTYDEIKQTWTKQISNEDRLPGTLPEEWTNINNYSKYIKENQYMLKATFTNPEKYTYFYLTIENNNVTGQGQTTLDDGSGAVTAIWKFSNYGKVVVTLPDDAKKASQ